MDLQRPPLQSFRTVFMITSTSTKYTDTNSKRRDKVFPDEKHIPMQNELLTKKSRGKTRKLGRPKSTV